MRASALKRLSVTLSSFCQREANKSEGCSASTLVEGFISDNASRSHHGTKL